MMEHAILGTIMTFPEDLILATNLLNINDFRSDKGKRVFSYMTQNECCDPLIIAEKAGITLNELTTWTERAGLRVFFEKECKELKEQAKAGKLKDLAREVLHTDKAPSELLALAEKRLAEIAGNDRDDSKTVKQIVPEIMKNLEYRWTNRGKVFGIPTGFEDLDEATTGIHPGELWIIAGRPGMGKSAFGANVIEQAASMGKIGRFFSTEMDQEQVVERMLAAHSRVAFSRMRKGNFKETDWPRMANSLETIQGFNIKIDKCPGINLQELKSRIRQQKKEGLDLVVLDYLQRMSIPGDNRSRAVGEVTRALKDLALELGIGIICLSQLSRSLESRQNKRPIMSDLRDSGEIEQDADVILFPYRESVYCEKCKQGINDHDHDTLVHQATAELIIEKQRNGPAPINIDVVWLRDFVKFENIGGKHGRN